MGIIGSKNIEVEQEKYFNLYKKELLSLSDIINNIIINEKSDPSFKKQEYNLLLKDTCNNYALFFKENLNKLPKMALKNLASELLLVPTQNEIVYVGKSSSLHKAELCNRISTHYVKILNVLNSIYGVLGLSNNGQNNVCNLAMTSLMMPTPNGVSVRFCEDKQYDIDINNLVGISEYLNMLIETEPTNEAYIIKFLKSLKVLLTFKTDDTNNESPKYQIGGSYSRSLYNLNDNNNRYDSRENNKLEEIKRRQQREIERLEFLRRLEEQEKEKQKEQKKKMERDRERLKEMERQKLYMQEKELKELRELRALQELKGLRELRDIKKTKITTNRNDKFYKYYINSTDTFKKEMNKESLDMYSFSEKMPIINENSCKTKFNYEISNKEWLTTFKKYKLAYELFKLNYKNNIDALKGILDKLYILTPENEYILKILNEDELNKIVSDTKITIHDFFTSCIKNYIQAIYEFNIVMNEKILEVEKKKAIESDIVYKDAERKRFADELKRKQEHAIFESDKLKELSRINL